MLFEEFINRKEYPKWFKYILAKSNLSLHIYEIETPELKIDAEFDFYSDSCGECSSFPSLIKKISELKELQSDANINDQSCFDAVFYICLIDDVSNEILGFTDICGEEGLIYLFNIATIGGNALIEKYNQTHALDIHNKHVFKYYSCFLLTATSIFCAKHKSRLEFEDITDGFFDQFRQKTHGNLLEIKRPFLSRQKFFYKNITSFEDLLPPKQYYIDKGLLNNNYSLFSALKESGIKYRSYKEKQRIFKFKNKKFFESSTSKYLETDENYKRNIQMKFAFFKLKQNQYPNSSLINEQEVPSNLIPLLGEIQSRYFEYTKYIKRKKTYEKIYQHTDNPFSKELKRKSPSIIKELRNDLSSIEKIINYSNGYNDHLEKIRSSITSLLIRYVREKMPKNTYKKIKKPL